MKVYWINPLSYSTKSYFSTIFADFFSVVAFVNRKQKEDLRLSQVLIDQLKVSPIHHTYLPSSKDKLLAPVLAALEQNPADNTSLELWAKKTLYLRKNLITPLSARVRYVFLVNGVSDYVFTCYLFVRTREKC